MSDSGNTAKNRRYLPVLSALAFALLFGVPQAAQGLADPTRPPAAAMKAASTGEEGAAEAPPPPPPPPEESWVLQSVMTSSGRGLAVINGKTLRVGQLLDGAELVEISPRGVRFKLDGREIVLKLSVGGFKSPATGTEDGKKTP